MHSALLYAYGIPVDFIHDIFLFHYFSLFSRIYIPTKITYVIVSFALPKRFRENPEGFLMTFLSDHVRWCCIRTEQYYQKSFVILLTILETTTAGKINWNTITLMTSDVNANVTAVFGENTS